VHATDKDTGLFGSVRYTGITGQVSDAFAMDSDTGLITVAMGSSLDREAAAQLRLTVHARDEDGKGNAGTVPLTVNLLDVNDNAPIFQRKVYEFTLNSDFTNFTAPAFIKVRSRRSLVSRLASRGAEWNRVEDEMYEYLYVSTDIVAELAEIYEC